MAGWKYGSFTMTYPSYINESDTLTKINHYFDNSKATLVGVVDQLIKMGWELDERHSDAQTPLVIYSSTNTTYTSYYGAFILRNSAGAKLLVAYGGGRFPDYGDSEKNTFGSFGYSTTRTSTSSREHTHGGLMMSMIPPGSNGDFTILGENSGCTIPDDATRVVSTIHSSGTQSLPISFNQRNDTITGTYHLLSKGNVVVVVSKCSTYDIKYRRGYIVGEIFGTLAHDSDSGIGCRFGAFELCGYGVTEEYQSTSGTSEITGISSDSIYRVNKYANSPRDQSMTFRRADGSHVYGNQIVVLQDVNQLDTLFCSSDGSTSRYVPFWMAESSINPSETGVIPGDGFKGYLSTDVIRCVRAGKFSRGQLFDGGNFVYVGGGIVIPWDPSITESIY